MDVQFSLVTQSCLTLCDLMGCSMPGFPVHHQLLGFIQLMLIESVMPSNHLILCHPLLLPPKIFLSIRVFSNESVLCIRQLVAKVQEHYSAIKRDVSESVLMMWMNLELVIQSEVSQKEKNKYVNTYICNLEK